MRGESGGVRELTEAVELLRAAAIDFVIVGVSGINFFARDEDDPEILASVIARAETLTARDDSGSVIDLMLAGAGLRFDDLSSDAVRFQVGATEVLVGALEKLLRSKQLAARPKDQEFLRMFAARFADDVEEYEGVQKSATRTL